MIISNLGERTLFWTAEADESWIDLGILEGSNDGQISVRIKGDLDPEKYSGAINIRSNDKNITIPVTLKVIAPARLAVSPDPLILSFLAYTTEPPAAQTMRIANSGEDVLDWQISSENSWITVAPSSGQLESGRSQELSVGIDTRDLESADLVGNLMITSNGGAQDGRVELKRRVYSMAAMPRILQAS